MEPKGECNLAVTQILHLHLYKTSSPVCLSGSISLFLFPSFLPPSLSFPCAVARGVVIFSMFSIHCALCVCVLIVAILGEGENDEEDLFESSRARFCGTTQRGAADTWSA